MLTDMLTKYRASICCLQSSAIGPGHSQEEDSVSAQLCLLLNLFSSALELWALCSQGAGRSHTTASKLCMMHGWSLLYLNRQTKAAVPLLRQVSAIPDDGLGEHRDCVCSGCPGISDQECSFFTLDWVESVKV